MKITLTGIDEETSLPLLKEISEREARVEWGILYTHTPEGRPRYPRREWIAEAVQVLHGRCALHVCGRGAREELLNAALGDVTRYVARVQINGNVPVEQVEEACAILGGQRPTSNVQRPTSKGASVGGVQLITQWGVHNREHSLRVGLDWNHALLVDESGGRGISPQFWKRPVTSKAVGFAGGLGPGNVRQEVRNMGELVSMPGAWIDMEGKLRDTMDRFNLGRAEAVLDQLAEVAS